MSSIVNKVKDAMTPGHHNTTSGAPEGTHGPHASRTTNAADPRVDSDRDHRAAPGSNVGGGSHAYAPGDNYSHSTTAGTTGTSGYTEGPHGSKLLL